MITRQGAVHALAALAALALALAAASGVAAQMPCSVAKEVAPGEVRNFHFQRAGSSEDLTCTFTFETQIRAPFAVLLQSFSFDNMTRPDCKCGALRMYDVSPSGELLLNITRCAGEEAGGAMLRASCGVAMITLATHGCTAPAFALAVGSPDALGVSTAPNATTTTSRTANASRTTTSTPRPAPVTRRPTPRAISPPNTTTPRSTTTSRSRTTSRTTTTSRSTPTTTRTTPTTTRTTPTTNRTTPTTNRTTPTTSPASTTTTGGSGWWFG